jgi:hypothetical protein
MKSKQTKRKRDFSGVTQKKTIYYRLTGPESRHIIINIISKTTKHEGCMKDVGFENHGVFCDCMASDSFKRWPAGQALPGPISWPC